MRGFPLQNLLFVLLILAALTIPLLRVDRPASVLPPDEAARAAADSTVPVLLRLRFAHPPLTVQVESGGQPVTLRGGGLERQAETSLGSLREGLELTVKATWPPGTGSTVVEVAAAPDGWPEQVRNVWAEAAAVEEIIRFTWRAKP